MIELRTAASFGKSNFHGVSSVHHFCFGPYQCAARVDWGRLRMLNRHDIAPNGRRAANFLAGMDVLLIVERGAIEAQSGDHHVRIGEGEAALLTMGSGADYGFMADNAHAEVIEIWLHDQPPAGHPAIRPIRSPIGAIERPRVFNEGDRLATDGSRIRTAFWGPADTAPFCIDIEGHSYLTLLEGELRAGSFDLKRNDSLAADADHTWHIEPREQGLLLIIDRLSDSDV